MHHNNILYDDECVLVTMATVESSSSLEQLLAKHFESHQRNACSDEKRSITVAARVAQIQQQLKEFALNDAVNSLALTSNKEFVGSSTEDVIADQLVHFVDCAIATEISSESDSQDSVDSILELAAAVAVGMSMNTNPAATAVLERAIQFSGAILERVRLTACKLIGYILEYSENPEIKDTDTDSQSTPAIELWEMAASALLPRLLDKSQAVRKAAIEAAANVFTENQEYPNTPVADTIQEALLYSVQHDPSVSNRVAAVQSLFVTQETIPFIIDRVRDVKPKVRVAALSCLWKKVNLTDLSADQCAELIRSGLTDRYVTVMCSDVWTEIQRAFVLYCSDTSFFSYRCTATKEAASKMICVGWIKAVKYKPVDLLRQLDVVLHEDECAKMTRVILEAAQTDSALQELSDPEIRAFREGIATATMQIRTADQALDAETVFFSRVTCTRAIESTKMTSGQKDAVTSKVVPDIPVLCEVFERHTVMLMQAIDQDDAETEDRLTSICLQLLLLASMADLEEGSRRHFAAVMKRMLGSIATPDDLVEGCLQALKSIFDKEVDFVDTVSEVVAELSSNLVEDALIDLTENHLVRILSVLTIVLENVSPRMASNPAIADFARHIVPAVTHANALVREAGVSCFGKMGLFTNEETVMSEFKPLMLQVASNEEEKVEIRAQAMLALSDWSMLFTDILTPCAVGDTTVSFPQLVEEMMIESKPAVVCIAAEVASKLLFAGRLRDSKWLAQLLMIFFDARLAELAMDEDDDDAVTEVGSPVRLQQILSIFFPAYAVKGKPAQEALMQSILPLLHLVHVKQSQKKKPRGTKALPIAKMMEYVCATVDLGESATKDAAEKAKTHDDETDEDTHPMGSSTNLLASVQIATFLSKESENLGTTFLRVLCKLLGGVDLDLECENPKDLSALKQLMEDLAMEITDTTSQRSLTQLDELLAEVVVEDEEKESSDDQASLADAFDNVQITGEDATEKENARNDEETATPVEKGRVSMDSSVGTRRSLRNSFGGN
jgi:condensin complex subunit 3